MWGVLWLVMGCAMRNSIVCFCSQYECVNRPVGIRDVMVCVMIVNVVCYR